MSISTMAQFQDVHFMQILTFIKKMRYIIINRIPLIMEHMITSLLE